VTTNQTVLFNPGENAKLVGIPMCPDLLTEPLETINLTLTGASVGTPATAVLSENDTANQFRSTNEIDFTQGARPRLTRRPSTSRVLRCRSTPFV